MRPITIWSFPNFLPHLSFFPDPSSLEATQASNASWLDHPQLPLPVSLIHSFLCPQLYAIYSDKTEREQEALQAAWGTSISWGTQKSKHATQSAEVEPTLHLCDPTAVSPTGCESPGKREYLHLHRATATSTAKYGLLSCIPHLCQSCCITEWNSNFFTLVLDRSHNFFRRKPKESFN